MLAYSFALTQTLWESIPETAVSPASPRQLVPRKYQTFALDTSALKTLLWQAPQEQEVSVGASTHIIELPTPEGDRVAFRFVQYNMMEAPLAEAYPHIRTFYGLSLERHPRRLRMDWTERGFHASFYTEGGKVFIDPYCFGNKSHYLVYYKKDYPAPAFECHFDDRAENYHAAESGEAKAGDCVFRSYRLAMATTGEYSNYHGGFNSSQSGLVLSAVTTAVNRVNQVYEFDFTIRLILIGNTANVFYYNGTTDPYTNNNGNTMLDENQSTIDAIIGTSNYDIGHVFSTGGGGVASLQSPCNSTRKAQGVTGLSAPIGDAFYIDYVAHEMGHQFGANHTQNNNCERNGPTAMEPGSASTIMGYAGVCPPNVQNSSDDYFHGVSIQEVANFVASGNGNSCDTPISFTNNAPTVNAGADYTIPVSTPFVLTANAIDLDGHTITYCWEQYDNETGPVMPPASSNSVGPMFRTFDPTASSARYFPRLSDLVNNTSPTWEVLPSVGRNMEFRITVRDLAGAAGCTGEDFMNITTSNVAGPFRVTAPNTSGVVWTIGQLAQVTWDVANSNLAPVSCANVDILLSYDGGFTYPTTLASGVSNSGSAFVTVPAGTSTTARVMVKGAGNVFFDISNANFTIQSAAAPDYSLGATPGSQSVCSPANAVFTINTTSVNGYASGITLSITNPPSGSSVGFSTNPVTPGSNSTLTFSNIGSVSPGTYNITVQGVSAAGNKSISVQLIVKGVNAGVSLNSPAASATDISIAPQLSWATMANTSLYEVELADNASFSPALLSTSTATTNYQLTSELSPLATYYWRVRSNNECGNGAWSTTRSFQTVPCLTYSSTNVPVSISASGTPTITSTLTVGESGSITDVNVVNLTGTHTYIQDLIIDIQSPSGTYINLLDQICTFQDNFNINFSDQAASNNYPCPPTGGGTYIPTGTLAGLNGQAMAGTWTLRIMDTYPEDGGQLQSWGIRVCPSGYSAPLPVSWLYVEASPGEDFIRLRWATGSENNNAGFDIERRAANETQFTNIGWSPALGKDGLGANYEWLDTGVKPGVRYYYRIKQVDWDGQGNYSIIKTAMLEALGKEICQIGWSLGLDAIYLECMADNGEYLPLSYSVFNAQGQKMTSGAGQGARYPVATGNWPAGVYWVIVQTNETVKTAKIVRP